MSFVSKRMSVSPILRQVELIMWRSLRFFVFDIADEDRLCPLNLQ